MNQEQYKKQCVKWLCMSKDIVDNVVKEEKIVCGKITSATGVPVTSGGSKIKLSK